MIEGTPGQPYGYLPIHFNMVEANMRLRLEYSISSFFVSSISKFLDDNKAKGSWIKMNTWWVLQISHGKSVLFRILFTSDYDWFLFEFSNGCPDCTWPHCDVEPSISSSGSLFFPDRVIFPDHPRFKYVHRLVLSFEFSFVSIVFLTLKNINEKYSLPP